MRIIRRSRSFVLKCQHQPVDGVKQDAKVSEVRQYLDRRVVRHEVGVFVEYTSTFFPRIKNQLQVAQEVTNQKKAQEKACERHPILFSDG